MARPASTPIRCPQCTQPFNAILEQIIDVQRDPTAKERLLSGRVNVIVCPHCGYRGMVGTPLLYHDASKQMAIVYVPMELGMEQSQREKLIGDFTNALMRSLPEDAPKGYLLQPRTALTMQGLLDQVLEADGITPEMLDKERRKVDLIRQIVDVDETQLESLLADNQELFDLTFFELLTAAAQGASQQGDVRQSLRLLNVRTRLMDTTEAGKALKEQEAAVGEAVQELEGLGENITREAFVDLLVKSANNPVKVQALATLGRNLLDYTTFQVLTSRIEQAPTEGEKEALNQVRNRLLDIQAEYERQSRAVLQRAADTLRMLVQSPDIPGAIRNNLDRIDDVFLQVLQVNLDEARKAGNVDVSSRLKEIRDEVLKLIQDSAPPEIRLVNELMGIESDEESLNKLRERKAEVNDNLLQVMEQIADQLRQGGNEPAANRVDLLKAEAQSLISS